MLDELFNRENQERMTDYFLNVLAPRGISKTYNKNKIIDPCDSNCIYIIVEGMVAQELVSDDGKQISLFMLTPGTIFGEMDYFEGSRTCSVTQVIKNNTILSVLNKQIIEEQLRINNELYRFFIHSIVRKYRILMLKIVDNHSNSFIGKLASTLIRFAIMEEGRIFDGARIKNIQSLTAFSNYLLCSRSTLSMTISDFRKKGIIDRDNKDIIIKDSEKLMGYINFVW